MQNEATYPWTREGVAEAVEAAMECWPRLREAFLVGETPGEGSAAGGTWTVRLDPHGTCRIARIRSAVVQAGALQQVAQALRAAVLEKLAADRANTARARA
jgi:hypothetical protein